MYRLILAGMAVLLASGCTSYGVIDKSPSTQRGSPAGYSLRH